MKNTVTITFSRNFVAGDSIGVYYSDPTTQTGGFWTFVWVSGTPGVFEVQVGNQTATTGEIEAIRFASAWGNSLNGFTVTQPVSGNANQVQITSQTFNLINVLAKFSDGSTMAIPGDYGYVLSTVSTGNKITYEQKFPLNTFPTTHSKYLWKSVDANEVKTKHNLNDDRIGVLETDKANLAGGNNFTGNQKILDGDLVVGDKDTEPQGSAGNVLIGVGDEDSGFYKPAFNEIGIVTDGSDAIRIDNNQNVGIGTTTPSEKLEVNGNVKASEYISGLFKVRDKGVSLDTLKGFTIEKTTNGNGFSFYTESQSQALEISTTMNQGFEFQQKVTFEDGIIASLTGGSVTVDKVNINAETFQNLPSSPAIGTIAVITDADSSDSSFVWRGDAQATTTVGNQRNALVFYDGSKWIYH